MTRVVPPVLALAWIVLVPLGFLLLVTDQVLLQAFAPFPSFTSSAIVRIFLPFFSWLLALVLLLHCLAAGADSDSDYPAAAVFVVSGIAVLLLIVPTAWFTWDAVTDRAYEEHGGVSSCVVTDVEEHPPPLIVVTSISEAGYTYTYALDCEVPNLGKWEAGDVELAEGDEVKIEYDATGRFELRRFEPHRTWQASARIAFYLWLAMPVLQLVIHGGLAGRRLVRRR